MIVPPTITTAWLERVGRAIVCCRAGHLTAPPMGGPLSCLKIEPAGPCLEQVARLSDFPGALALWHLGAYGDIAPMLESQGVFAQARAYDEDL